MADDESIYTEWLAKNELTEGKYYLMVCRFVPENSFKEILESFLPCSTKKKLVIFTTHNDRLFDRLEQELHFCRDPRIHFAGTLYDVELLKKVRENAYAYIHCHTVGGTNPTLLEAMALTKVILLRDVPFNREDGQDTVLYWEPDELTDLIERVDKMTDEERFEYDNRSQRAYNWRRVAEQYTALWTKPILYIGCALSRFLSGSELCAVL